MKEHVKQHGEATHECQECGKKYKSPVALKCHQRHFHREKPPIQCSHCDKTFKSKSKLRAHMSYVTGEVQFSCRICQAGYVHSTGFRKHFSLHHPGEPIYYCQACDFGTNSKIEFTRHSSGSVHRQKINFFQAEPQVSSETFKCSDCEYRNANLACLKRHMSIKHMKTD